MQKSFLISTCLILSVIGLSNSKPFTNFGIDSLSISKLQMIVKNCGVEKTFEEIYLDTFTQHPSPGMTVLYRGVYTVAKFSKIKIIENILFDAEFDLNSNSYGYECKSNYFDTIYDCGVSTAEGIILSGQISEKEVEHINGWLNKCDKIEKKTYPHKIIKNNNEYEIIYSDNRDSEINYKLFKQKYRIGIVNTGRRSLDVVLYEKQDTCYIPIIRK